MERIIFVLTNVHLTSEIKMKKITRLTLLCAVLGFMIPQAKAASFVGDTEGQPTYNRVTEDGTSSFIGSTVPFSLFSVTVDTTGLYNFSVVAGNSALLDTFITLYNAPFNSLDPETNFIVANDNTSQSNQALGSSFVQPLTSGSTYVLAVSGLTNDDYGTFSGSVNPVTGPGTASVTAVPEPSTTTLLAIAASAVAWRIARKRRVA